MRRLYEWKDAQGNKVYLNNNTSSTASNTNNTSTNKVPSYKEKFKELLAQIDKEKNYTYNVVTLTDNALVFELTLDTGRKITIAIVYKPYTNPPVWKVGVNNNIPLDYKDWNEVLDVFEIPGIIKDVSSLKESVHSIVEEFKDYDSMWMTPQEVTNDLYIVYNDYDDGSYDILYASSNLKIVKEIFRKEAIDFMLPAANADQSINLLQIKLNKLSSVDDKEFLSLLSHYDGEVWDAREFTMEENKLFSKYEKLFWGSDSNFSVLKSFTDVDAYEEAVDQELDPNDMTEEEWREFVEEYVDFSIL